MATDQKEAGMKDGDIQDLLTVLEDIADNLKEAKTVVNVPEIKPVLNVPAQPAPVVNVPQAAPPTIEVKPEIRPAAPGWRLTA